MGVCYSHSRTSMLKGAFSPEYCLDPLPELKKELNKDLKRVIESALTRRRISRRFFSNADLDRAYSFAELQIMLPRKRCVDTQVLVLSALQLACCGILLSQPGMSSQAPLSQNVCLHVLFDNRPFNMEAHGVALANLARLLSGNTSLEKLSLNLMGVTAEAAGRGMQRIYTSVMESFAAMLCVNRTLRLLRFEGMVGKGDELPWNEEDAELVCKAQAAHQGNLRLAFLVGRHRRSREASPLVRALPQDLLHRILGLAIPLHPTCKVEFDFFREDAFLEELGMLPAALFREEHLLQE